MDYVDLTHSQIYVKLSVETTDGNALSAEK